MKNLKTFLERIGPLQGMISLVLLIVGVIYGGTVWIQTTAQNSVLNEKFLAALAAKVRPTCIFDSRGSVEADFGASEYINNIQIKPRPEIYGYEVLIEAKKSLTYAPLVSGIDVSLVPQTSTRGKMYDWNIILTPNSTFQSIVTESGLDTNILHHFKLEILH